jgi:HlyD family secretion protein
MKQFFSRFSRRTWIIIGTVALILVIVIFARSRGGKKTTYETAIVERGNLVATVGATGIVRSKQSASLIWQTSGTVDVVNVKIGSLAKQNDVLASLDQQTLNQNIILAEADLVSAQKALDNLLISDTARAQAARTLDSAETAYKKAYDYRMSLNGRITLTEAYLDHGIPKVRYFKGYADKETISDADEKLALAKAQLDDARRAYERLKNGTDPADVAAARARVAAAQATLNLASIIAPFDGTVTQADSAPGDQVNAGTSAFRLDDLSHMLVDLQVSEVDINTVGINQTATLTFDAILGKVYHGKVVEVGQAGDNVQGVVNFTVVVELTDADNEVKPGMTAAVSIVVEEIKGVVLIPNRAVRVVNSERVVYLLVNNQAQMEKIHLGSSSDINSVLASGKVKEGDLIILNPPSTVGGPFGG